MIAADGVGVRLGNRTVLDDVHLAVRSGTVTGIIGPNGSGKSTLLRAMLGTLPLSTGTLRVDGLDLRRLRRRAIARRLSFVAQHTAETGALRVREEVALGALARGGARAAGDTRAPAVVDALAALGLTAHADTPVSALSGGERQRVALARAMVHGADHALLDEPMNHLDIRHRLELIALLPRIAPTVVVVLHDLELAARTCDDIVLLDGGRVIAQGPPPHVLHPDHLDAVYGVRTRVREIDGIPRLHFDLDAGSPSPERLTR